MLISQCTHSDGDETLQHKLRVGGKKKKQWVFEKGSFLRLQKQEESDVPSVSAQSALAVYDLSMILNGCDIFSLHISFFFLVMAQKIPCSLMKVILLQYNLMAIQWAFHEPQQDQHKQ